MNLYDFDKTIYLYDSSRKFYFFCLKKKPKLWWHLFKTAYYGLLKTFKIIPLKKFKEKLFSIVKYIPDLDKMVSSFWDNEILFVNEWYFEKREKDDVICSASPRFLLEDIVKRINIDAKLICSEIDKNTGLYLPNFENCKGDYKVVLLKQNNLLSFNEGYSDSNSDIPMLKLCRKKFRVTKGKISVFEKSYFE